MDLELDLPLVSIKRAFYLVLWSFSLQHFGGSTLRYLEFEALTLQLRMLHLQRRLSSRYEMHWTPWHISICHDNYHSHIIDVYIYLHLHLYLKIVPRKISITNAYKSVRGQKKGAIPKNPLEAPRDDQHAPHIVRDPVHGGPRAGTGLSFSSVVGSILRFYFQNPLVAHEDSCETSDHRGPVMGSSCHSGHLSHEILVLPAAPTFAGKVCIGPLDQ